MRRNKHATHSNVESTGPTTHRGGAGGQWEESSLNPKFPIWATEQVAWQPTPVFLPENLHGQRCLASCSPWGFKESDMTERLSTGGKGAHRDGEMLEEKQV